MLMPVLSVYLDLVRFAAALTVMLHHVWPTVFPDRPLPWPGHDAVVVFFVLSGLVIAHAVDRPGRTVADYCQHRIARIGPVAFPALLLSAAIAPWTGAPSPSTPSTWCRTAPHCGPGSG